MTEITLANKLSIERTLMAADRTLMAWIRTALSMISFGFTIYKVIQGMQSEGQADKLVVDGWLPGLVLAGLGTISILVGMIEYSLTIQSLQKSYPVSHRRFSMIIALGMLVIGILIFFAIAFRVR